MDLANTPHLTHVGTGEMAVRLLAALVGGLFVNLIYKKSRPATQVSPSFPPTLVLLAVLIGMVTQVVGNELARAFSLVGALSIIRFRTVVRDTQDTAFVIFAVVEGMAAGAGSYPIAILGLVIGGAATFLMKAKRNVLWTDVKSSLSLRLGLGANPNTLLKPVFDTYLLTHEILSVTTVRQGAALDYVYRVHLKADADPAAFVKELNTLDGIQNVELRRGEPEEI